MPTGPSSSPLLDRAARAAIARRRAVAAVLAAVTAIAVAGALRVEADFTPDDLFTGLDDQRAASAAFQAAFGNTDNVALVLVEAADALAPPVLQYVHDATRSLGARPWAAHAASVTTVPAVQRIGPPSGPASAASLLADLAAGRLRIAPPVDGAAVDAAAAARVRAAVAANRLLEGRLVSRDRRLAVVAVTLAAGVSRNDAIERAVEDMEAWVAAHSPPAGVRVRLGGLPVLRVGLIRKMKADQVTLFPATFAVCLLILLATFRWLPALLLPPVAVGLSALTLVGAMGWLGVRLDIINNIVPMLIIVIGLSDSIHIVTRYGERAAAGADSPTAATDALRSMAVACFLTSFTTAVGFASLAVSDMPILRRFGLLAAFGVLAAYAITVAFVPIALASVRPPRQPIADHEHGRIEHALDAVLRRVRRRRIAVLAVAAAVLAAAAAAASTLTIDTFVADQYEPDDPAYATLQLVERELLGVRPIEVSIAAPPGTFDRRDALAALERIAQWAAAQPGVLDATGYPALVRETWVQLTGDPAARSGPLPDAGALRALGAALDAAGAARAFVTPDRARARLTVSMRDVGGRALLRFAAALRARAEAELASLPGVRVDLAGEGYVSSLGLDTVTSDLVESLVLATAIIFAVLAGLFRSVRLGLVSLPPNVLPLALTLGYMRLRGIPLNTATAIIFAITIGLAVDGTIHILARYVDEQRSGADRDSALAAAMRGTGKAVVASYLSLVVGFSILQLSEFVPVQQFGELVAVTIAGCLVSTLVVLPALLASSPRRSASRAV
ncbi:MAG: hypothetical protein D6689_19520 [Deltaproteobacteria bacterium]|nr:MAG: hypothetical protein D6689_19520 [Deltaproteobacteria bacterium]